MSEEFHISLDVMLKEDQKMVKKLNKEIILSKRFKKRAILILVCTTIVLAIGAAGWGIAWNQTRNSLEAGFQSGVEANGFQFDEQSGCHVSNYSSYLRQFYRRLNLASPLYRLSQRAVFYGTFLSALLTIPILSHIVFS